jgi:hypothetical protein
MIAALPISPLSLADLVRDLWGSFDAAAIAQLAPLAYESCYQPKFYKAPSLGDELFAANGYASYGLRITPGSIIYGFYLPALVSTFQAPQFNVQITDLALDHQRWNEPIPSYFLGNFRPTYLSALAYPAAGAVGSFPHLFDAPYPVVGSGLFNVELWETSGNPQRIELVFGVLEVIG